jgi:hypothetical protein
MDHLIIIGGAVLTAAIETPLFILFGFKTKRFVWVCIGINLLTNLVLNYVFYLSEGYLHEDYWIWLLVGELLAVTIESLTYLFIEPHKYELIPLTIAANILSFLCGVVYYMILIFSGIPIF